MKILSWNCQRAGATDRLWELFREISPDIALLQEVTGVPDSILQTYHYSFASPLNDAGGSLGFKSAILAKGPIGDAVPFRSSTDWVNRELSRFSANVLAHTVRLEGCAALNVVSVHSPAWPVTKSRLEGLDLSPVKLTQNPDVWVGDLLVAALKEVATQPLGRWVIGGDFNACETFDSWGKRPRGNREWLDRMAALGLTDCLRHSRGALTPTYRRPGKPEPSSQLDYVFVTSDLMDHLDNCVTGDAERVFSQPTALSDHLPVIAVFRPSEPHAR